MLALKLKGDYQLKIKKNFLKIFSVICNNFFFRKIIILKLDVAWKKIADCILPAELAAAGGSTAERGRLDSFSGLEGGGGGCGAW